MVNSKKIAYTQFLVLLRLTPLQRLLMICMIVVLMLAFTQIMLHRQEQITHYKESAKEENAKTLYYLKHVLIGQIAELLINSEGKETEYLRQNYHNLDQLINNELSKVDADVLKIKIYNLAGVAVYSSFRNDIGLSSNHPEFLSRALNGETVNVVEHRDNFIGKDGPISDVYIAMTYQPLIIEGRRVGVIEIYDDARYIFGKIYKDTSLNILYVLGSSALLFCLLAISIFRTDRSIIKWQEALSKNEALLTSILENALDAVIRFDSNGDITGWNSQAEKAFGWSKEEARGRNFFELLIPERNRDSYDQGIKQFTSNRKSTIVNRHIECFMQSREGHEFPVECAITPTDVSSGIEFCAFIRDISERKFAENQLRVAAVAFETDEAIMITDAQSNIIRVNSAFTRTTGYEPEEVLGKNPRILSSGRMGMEFFAEMWKELLATGTWSGEIWDRRKSGEVYPKWLTVTAVKNEEGDITEFVAMFSDITARKKAEEEIRNLAFYDALTGLPNRRLLMERFQLAQSVSDRNLHYGAVLFLDMDKFKTLNDTLGHDHGDLMLLDVAKRIQSCVREADTVARLGGDEFVVLLEGIGISEEEASQKAAVIAEKIRQSLSEPYQLKEHEYHCSPSMGVCLFRAYKESIDNLLKHADVAMYQAKEAGRNTVRFFDPAMQQVVQVRAALERDLRHAVTDSQLVLAPIEF